jgi:26S proteasome regulatory subunit N10
MGLEATLIILDNSKYSLNGDIIPSRLDAQLEACALLAQAKLDENQESTVGIMTMAGRAVEVGFHDLSGAADSYQGNCSHKGYFPGY